MSDEDDEGSYIIVLFFFYNILILVWYYVDIYEYSHTSTIVRASNSADNSMTEVIFMIHKQVYLYLSSIRKPEKVMNAESALRWCSAANDWVEFSRRTVTAAEKIDLSFISSCKLQHIDETTTFIDWRYAMSTNISHS